MLCRRAVVLTRCVVDALRLRRVAVIVVRVGVSDGDGGGVLASSALVCCCNEYRCCMIAQELARQRALMPLLDAATSRAETLYKARVERRKRAREAGAGASSSDDDE